MLAFGDGALAARLVRIRHCGRPNSRTPLTAMHRPPERKHQSPIANRQLIGL